MGFRSSIRSGLIAGNRKRLARNATRDAIISGGGLPPFNPGSGFPSFDGGFQSDITVSGIPLPGGGTISGDIPGTGGFDFDIDLGDSSIPGIPQPSLAPTGGNRCLPFFSPDPITGECVFDVDPGAGTGLPGGGAAAGTGLNRPRAVSRTVLDCPTFADGRKGILWMNALTGDVVCLPRRTSGKGFGLIRKNPPRAKPFISAAEKKLLNKISSVQKRAKTFATDAGFSCKKR